MYKYQMCEQVIRAEDQEIVHIYASTYASLSPWEYEPRIKWRLSAGVNKQRPSAVFFSPAFLSLLAALVYALEHNNFCS
jgi:hypothetical protein